MPAEIILEKDINAITASSTAINTKRAFFNWLAEGNARKYPPSVAVACIDKVSEYAIRKKVCHIDLWCISRHSTFKPIYTKILNAKLFRIMEQNTYRTFSVVGQLYGKFLKENSLAYKTDSPSTDNGDTTKSYITFKHAPDDIIDPEDVIAWLVTQPNKNGTLYLENVVRQYMSALRTAPAKLELPTGLNCRNVFTCHTPTHLLEYWDMFRTAPNYKQVNSNTSAMFSSGMGCLLRYLQYKNHMSPINEEKSEGQSTLDPIIHEQLTSVLSKHFANGFRLSSPIELVRFKSFADKVLGENNLTPDEKLREYIVTCGMLCDGKVYAVSEQVKHHIEELATKYFAQGAQAIFFSEFFSQNESWLLDGSVVSEDVLISILHEQFPTLSFTRTYFGYTDKPINAILESEILRVWGDAVLQSYGHISEKLQYIPFERIKYALAQNRDFIWNSFETFSHISLIRITDGEKQAISEAAAQECNNCGYASIANLPYGEIEYRNHQLSITGLHNAIYRICLSDDFDKKGKIITRKGAMFDALTIMKEYCKTVDRCTLDDLLNDQKELTGEVHRWIPMEAANTILVRIDKDTYMADKYVNFNPDLIDEAIGLVLTGSYVPLKRFATFSAFPDCGVPWNLFLLESYCRRFSKTFRFDALTINSRNAGAIIRQDCEMDYTQIMTDAVLKAGISLSNSAIGHFLFDSGYIGRATTTKVNEIIVKAKIMRERQD